MILAICVVTWYLLSYGQSLAAPALDVVHLATSTMVNGCSEDAAKLIEGQTPALSDAVHISLATIDTLFGPHLQGKSTKVPLAQSICVQ